jgi:hypothetical protein
LAIPTRFVIDPDTDAVQAVANSVFGNLFGQTIIDGKL